MKRKREKERERKRERQRQRDGERETGTGSARGIEGRARFQSTLSHLALLLPLALVDAGGVG